MSPTEEEKAEPSSSSSSAWKDVPRRLITVSLGVPSIILLLRNPITSWLFFQGAHILCLIEWGALLPTPSYSSEDNNNNNGNTNNNKNEDDTSTVLMARFMYCTFCLFSILITSISTSSALPLWLMSFGITIRLLPHFYLPTYQRQQQTNKDNQTSSKTTTTTILHDIVMMQQHYQFGLLYLSLGFHYIIQISKIGGPIHIGNLLFIVWMSDTGALILGRIVKKKTMNKSNNDATTKTMNKRDKNNEEEEDKTNGFFVSFLKSISPGKTIPGLLGGIISGPISSLIYPITLPPSTILSSFFSVEEGQCNNEDEECSTTSSSYITAQLFNFFYNNNPTNQKILLGLLLSTSGIIGDLAESSVKRMSMKKDSGSLLPGHGGVVDRFDSLFVAAIVYYYLILA